MILSKTSCGRTGKDLLVSLGPAVVDLGSSGVAVVDPVVATPAH